MSGRFDQPEPLKLRQLSGLLGREIVCLTPVCARVVQLPVVVVEGGHFLRPSPMACCAGSRRSIPCGNAAVPTIEVLCLVLISALASLKESAMLTPSIGCCWTPLTKIGWGRPAA